MSTLRKGLTIKTVAARTNVSLHTLRAWERRYGVPQPSRERGNQYRLYDEEDIADVLWLKAQVAQGMMPSQASALLRAQGRSVSPTATPLPLATDSLQPLHDKQTALHAALVQMDEQEAQRILDEALGVFAPEQVALQIMQPTLRQLGEEWQRNEISVRQEHLASHIIRQRLLSILQALPLAPAHAPRFIAACAPQEQHEIGLLMLALLARRRGWQVAYLGAQMPLPEIAQLANASTPQAVVMSVATTVGLVGLLPWLNAHERPKTRVLFGGYLLQQVPELRLHLPGAYISNDPIQCLSELNRTWPTNEIWSPTKRLHKAALAIQVQQLNLASTIVKKYLASLPRSMRSHAPVPEIHYETLYLLNAFIGALAFDTPQLLDHQSTWMKAMLTARQVPSHGLMSYVEIYGHTMNEVLDTDLARTLDPLVKRWQAQMALETQQLAGL